MSPRKIRLDRETISPFLKGLERWVIWRAGPVNEEGKFSKVPLNVTTLRNANANDPSNWVSFEQACGAYDAGKCSGIGIALTDQPVTASSEKPLYLVAVDLDNCAEDLTEAKALRAELGIYSEVSPSYRGIRMFALSREPIKGGNDGKNHELYGGGRFMTVTGIKGRGKILEITSKLQNLERQWFPKRSSKKPPFELDSATRNILNSPRPETSENIELVGTMLARISADCEYELWMKIVWSVLSTGWTVAEDLARKWSQTAPHRYEENAFSKLVNSYVPDSTISLGTLYHHARENGWTDPSPKTEKPNLTSSRNSHKRLLTVDEIKSLPPIEWRVRKLLPARGVAAIYGPSGSGKTFLALDLGCAIAAQKPLWFREKIKAAPVVYIALEGEAGIRQRLEAWEAENKQPLSGSQLRLVLGDFDLQDRDAVDALIKEILIEVGKSTVVFIDTLNQSAPGADENSSADMGTLITNAKDISNALEGIVVLVHHSGKDTKRGLRGHSSLVAAMDAVLEVSKKKAERVFRIGKMKDGEDGIDYGFDLAPHEVGKDDESMPIVSCAVRPSLSAVFNSVETPPIRGKHNRSAYETLLALEPKYPDGIPLEDAHTSVAKDLDCDDEWRRVQRAKEAIKHLAESGHLRVEDDRVFLD